MSIGRPRATSRDVIAEAACELFLEQGFEGTTVADITQRAGVSRSSFFNYFTAKSDVLWAGLDERIATLETLLLGDTAGDAAAEVRAAVRGVGEGFAPDSLALALVHTDAMGLADELERDAGIRRSRIAAAISHRLRADGVVPLRAEVAGAAHAGAVLSAIEVWATAGPGRAPLGVVLAEAMDAAGLTLP